MCMCPNKGQPALSTEDGWMPYQENMKCPIPRFSWIEQWQKCPLSPYFRRYMPLFKQCYGQCLLLREVIEPIETHNRSCFKNPSDPISLSKMYCIPLCLAHVSAFKVIQTVWNILRSTIASSQLVPLYTKFSLQLINTWLKQASLLYNILWHPAVMSTFKTNSWRLLLGLESDSPSIIKNCEGLFLTLVEWAPL